MLQTSNRYEKNSSKTRQMQLVETKGWKTGQKFSRRLLINWGANVSDNCRLPIGC